MKPNQMQWSRSRDDLASALGSLGYPEELADLLAKELGAPQAIDRMASWLLKARPVSMELIVDEMLAIKAEIEAWREKKAGQEAQAGYSAWLNSAERARRLEEEDSDL